MFRSVAHGACIREGKPAPNETLQRELADAAALTAITQVEEINGIHWPLSTGILSRHLSRAMNQLRYIAGKLGDRFADEIVKVLERN